MVKTRGNPNQLANLANLGLNNLNDTSQNFLGSFSGVHGGLSSPTNSRNMEQSKGSLKFPKGYANEEDKDKQDYQIEKEENSETNSQQKEENLTISPEDAMSELLFGRKL